MLTKACAMENLKFFPKVQGNESTVNMQKELIDARFNINQI